jgi:hypothetical protein
MPVFLNINRLLLLLLRIRESAISAQQILAQRDPEPEETTSSSNRRLAGWKEKGAGDLRHALKCLGGGANGIAPCLPSTSFKRRLGQP